jgi:hypothetical protein
MKNKLIALAAAAALALGAPVAAEAAPKTGDLFHQYTLLGSAPDQPLIYWRVTNTGIMSQTYTLTYNDESGAILSTQRIALLPGNTETFAIVPIIEGNGVVLSATLYEAGGRKIETLRLSYVTR